MVKIIFVSIVMALGIFLGLDSLRSFLFGYKKRLALSELVSGLVLIIVSSGLIVYC